MNGYKKFSDFAQEEPAMDGEKVKIKDIIDKEIFVTAYKMRTSKYSKSNSEQCLTVHFQRDEQSYIFFTGSAVLTEQIEKYKNEIPFLTTIRKIDKYYTFSEGDVIMKGLPAHLNTKDDYLNIKDTFCRTVWEPMFQALLDSRLAWINVGGITEGDGITNETHKVVNCSVGELIVKFQFEFKEDPAAKIFRVGFTVGAVKEIVNSI